MSNISFFTDNKIKYSPLLESKNQICLINPSKRPIYIQSTELLPKNEEL